MLQGTLRIPSARTRTQHTQIKTNNKYQKINEGYHISPLLHSTVVFNQGTGNQDALLKENKKVGINFHIDFKNRTSQNS